MEHRSQLVEAEQQLAGGRVAEAEATCRSLLANQPEDADALSLLGGILCHQGKFAEAVAYVEQAAGYRPLDSQVLADLGVIHWAAKHIDQSIQCYRRALELNSRDAQTHNNLGVALKHVGEDDEAIESFQNAIRLQSDLALPYEHLGEIFHQRGQRDEAIACYRRAIELAPKNPRVMNRLGIVLAETGQHTDAIAWYQKALRQKPDFVEAENNLADGLRYVGRLDEAVVHCRRAIQLRPELFQAHTTLGIVLRMQGKMTEAVEQYREALNLEPNSAHAHNSLGVALMDVGQFDQAREHFEEALRCDPNHAPVYQNMSELAMQAEYRLTDEQFQGLRDVLSSGRVPPDEACQLQMAYASIMDREGEYDEAFDFYQKGNDTKQQLLESAGDTFEPATCTLTVDSIISIFGAEYFERAERGGMDTERPIFVVGMPRSGTTLVHQIIASHPEASGVGELTDIAMLANELSDRVERGQPYPLSVPDADRQVIAELAQRYLDRIIELGNDASRIVDKAPANFFFLGFIGTLFPKARIVHCLRDKMDVCLSCYFHNFRSVTWSHRLTDIGHFYQQYQRLMAHWREVLPLRLHEVSYEELVGDPNRISRELIEFCGLEWNDQCLEYHSTHQAVHTPSRVQVRQPIFTTSVGRWKNYERHLEPLRSALREAAD